MAKATVMKHSEYPAPAGRMVIRVEGAREFMQFAYKRLVTEFSCVKGAQYTDKAGECAMYFIMDEADRASFMAAWKLAKTEFPKAFPCPEQIKKARPNAQQIEEAARALEKAEASLKRAISRGNQPERSQKYLQKNICALRGAHRRAHRTLVMSEREAIELAAIFEDKECNKPRKLVYRPTPYKDHTGRTMKRQACQKSALLHWADIVQANSLATCVGSVTPDYAARMVKQFGSLEAYLSYLRVGDTSAMRLPVIERALAQLRAIPRETSGQQLLEAYQMATVAVEEFAAWLDLVNAMYHHDILRLLEKMIGQQSQFNALLDETVIALRLMRNRLVKPEPGSATASLKKRDAGNTPYVISVCTPDEEEAA